MNDTTTMTLSQQLQEAVERAARRWDESDKDSAAWLAADVEALLPQLQALEEREERLTQAVTNAKLEFDAIWRAVQVGNGRDDADAANEAGRIAENASRLMARALASPSTQPTSTSRRRPWRKTMDSSTVERKLICSCGHSQNDHGYGIGDGCCYACNGDPHPFDGVPYVPCPECRGSGRWLLRRLYGDDVIEREEPCPSCNGLGWVNEEARA